MSDVDPFSAFTVLLKEEEQSRTRQKFLSFVALEKDTGGFV